MNNVRALCAILPLQYEHVSQHVQGCDACARSPEFCDPSVGCELQSPTLAHGSTHIPRGSDRIPGPVFELQPGDRFPHPPLVGLQFRRISQCFRSRQNAANRTCGQYDVRGRELPSSHSSACSCRELGMRMLKCTCCHCLRPTPLHQPSLHCKIEGTIKPGEQLCLVWWLQPPNWPRGGQFLQLSKSAPRSTENGQSSRADDGSIGPSALPASAAVMGSISAQQTPASRLSQRARPVPAGSERRPMHAWTSDFAALPLTRHAA